MNWFEELKNQALITFPNMPTNYVENAVQKAARRFFRETHLLKDDAYITAECGMNDYIIDVPDGRPMAQMATGWNYSTRNRPSASPIVYR